MASPVEPMIKLEPGGVAPILSYNVPEPTSYTGSNYIELDVAQDCFTAATSTVPSRAGSDVLKTLEPSVIKEKVIQAMKTGFSDPLIFGNTKSMSAHFRVTIKPNPGVEVTTDMPSCAFSGQPDPEEIAYRLQNGERLNIYRTLYGSFRHNFVREPTTARPRLMLRETYRLSSYLGNYGAGRTIKTFSLLPGEKTKISIKTYMKRESDAKQASCILDSFTEDSAQEFETSVQTEQSDKDKYEENFSYHTEAEASCSWGFGSAKVSGGVKGGSNSAREEFAKNVSNATEKHTAKASAKRDVQVNTSFEVKQESIDETCTERELQNINVSRTLNFVFRQMNQEYITLLHLVDVRVAYFNGFAESYREVPLSAIDSLLDDVIVAEKVDQVKQSIVDEIRVVFDYADNPQQFVQSQSITNLDGSVYSYWRVDKNLASTYKDPGTQTEIKVPGVILSANKHVLRTDGIIVEALLGQGDALDTYSHGLQNETVRAKAADNELVEMKAKREMLGVQIVENKDEEAMKIYQGVFPPPPTNAQPVK